MKRSDIRSAYDQMTPTREQKDRMLYALLKEEKFLKEKKSGKYQSASAKNHRWNWIPAAAALVLVLMTGIMVFSKMIAEDPALSKGKSEPVSLDVLYEEIPQLRIARDWNLYLQEYSGTNEENLSYPYSLWGCRNQEMAQKLDEICRINALTFRNLDEKMTDNFPYLMEELQLQSILKEADAHEIHSCAWWEDGQFYFSGSLVLDGTARKDPVRYVFHRTYDSVFLNPYIAATSDSALDCWKYTNEAGMELFLALGREMSFVFADLGTDIIFVEVNRDLHGFTSLNDAQLTREELEILADSFCFTLTKCEDPELLYAPVLSKYRTAIEEGWSEDRCRQESISFRFAASAEYAKNNAGYCLVDLDENGMNELIVGNISAGDLNIWDIWSLDSDGVPVSIATTADYGTTICLYEGNIIGTDTSTKDHGDTGFYTWDMDTGFQMLDGITSDGSNYYDVVDQKNISAEDAMYIIMGKYEMICPELTYLMDVPDYLREGSESMEIYEQTLEKYKTALQEKWSPARCAEEGISILMANFADNPTQVGYTILDLDGDSREELLITDGNVILGMYALRAGMVTQIFSGWERSAYYLTDGLGIYHHGSNGAANTLYNYYRYSNGSLVLEEAVIFDVAADPEHPWFHQTPEGEITPVSEEAALEIMQYRCTVEIVFTPFTSDPQP